MSSSLDDKIRLALSRKLELVGNDSGKAIPTGSISSLQQPSEGISNNESSTEAMSPAKRSQTETKNIVQIHENIEGSIDVSSQQTNEDPVSPSQSIISSVASSLHGSPRSRTSSHLATENHKLATFNESPNSSMNGTVSHSPTPEAGVDRFEHLYNQAQKYEQKKQQMAKKLEDENTYKPQINESSRKIASSKSDAPTKRYEELYKKAEEKRARDEEKRKSLEETSFSFHPEITAKAKRAPSPAKPRYELLYSETQKMKERRESLEQEKLKREMDGCTFKPTVNKRPPSAQKSRPNSSSGQTPASDNTADSANAAANISPGKSTVSETAPFWERMSQYREDTQAKIERLRQTTLEKEKRELTFKPKVMRSPSRERERPEQQEQSGDVHSRLYQKDYLKDVTSRREEAKRQEEEKFTFKPQIGRPPSAPRQRPSEPSAQPPAPATSSVADSGNELSNSNSKGESDAKSTGSTGSSTSIFERLYLEMQEKKKKIEEFEAIAAEKEVQGCTFVPNTDRQQVIPKLHNPNERPVWERLSETSKQEVIKSREDLKKQQEKEICTFKPKISRPPSPSPTKKSESIFERLAAEKIGDEEKVKKLAADEMAECTFKPQVSHRRSGSANLDVNGDDKPVWERLNAEGNAQDRERHLQQLREKVETERKMSDIDKLSPQGHRRTPSSGSVRKGSVSRPGSAARSRPPSASSSRSSVSMAISNTADDENTPRTAQTPESPSPTVQTNKESFTTPPVTKATTNPSSGSFSKGKERDSTFLQRLKDSELKKGKQVTPIRGRASVDGPKELANVDSNDPAQSPSKHQSNNSNSSSPPNKNEQADDAKKVNGEILAPASTDERVEKQAPRPISPSAKAPANRPNLSQPDEFTRWTASIEAKLNAL